MLSDNFISSTHFTTFALFSDTEAWRWVLMYFFMTDSGCKNVWAYVNYDTTPKVLVFQNLRVLNPASKSVKIDFGNERHSEPGNVVCPWWRREEGDEQKQKLYKERGVKCYVTTSPQKEKNSSKKTNLNEWHLHICSSSVLL
jgi:hypothetical protein